MNVDSDCILARRLVLDVLRVGQRMRVGVYSMLMPSRETAIITVVLQPKSSFQSIASDKCSPLSADVQIRQVGGLTELESAIPGFDLYRSSAYSSSVSQPKC